MAQWRRRRDSNPRYAINVYALSRGAPSAARPLLRMSTILTPSEAARHPAAVPATVKRLVLLPGDIVVFSVRVMLVGKAPCAGNGRRPWPARQRGPRASRERPSGWSVSAPGQRCTSWQGHRPFPARRALPGTLTDQLNMTISPGRSTSSGSLLAGKTPRRMARCIDTLSLNAARGYDAQHTDYEAPEPARSSPSAIF